MPETKPSFYKNFNEESANKLSLPQFFVMKYQKFLPKTAKLRICSGKTWDVKLEETEYEKCCFTGGWTEFVIDLELELGELLLFWYNVDESVFDVTVYRRNYCIREISDMADDDKDFLFMNHGAPNVPPEVNEKQQRSFTRKSEAAGTDTKTNPRLEVVMTTRARSYLYLPIKFAEVAGLAPERVVVLQYPPKQQSWPALVEKRRLRGYTLHITEGWAKFRKDNGLVYGQTYSFEFDPTKKVIQVKEKKY